MSDVITSLNLLIDSLKVKESKLNEILEYTKEQEKLLLMDNFDLKIFNNIMKNKQFRIESVLQIDAGFKPTYERVRNYLEKNPDLYREYISELQKKIKGINDKNIEIQVIEQSNHAKYNLIIRGLKGNVKEYRTKKKTVKNYYTNFNKQQESVRSNLFDSKK